jgi:hypothetical protein
LIASSYAFHSRATKAIQDAAYAVLAKELK